MKGVYRYMNKEERRWANMLITATVLCSIATFIFLLLTLFNLLEAVRGETSSWIPIMFAAFTGIAYGLRHVMVMTTKYWAKRAAGRIAYENASALHRD